MGWPQRIVHPPQIGAEQGQRGKGVGLDHKGQIIGGTDGGQAGKVDTRAQAVGDHGDKPGREEVHLAGKFRQTRAKFDGGGGAARDDDKRGGRQPDNGKRKVDLVDFRARRIGHPGAGNPRNIADRGQGDGGLADQGLRQRTGARIPDAGQAGACLRDIAAVGFPRGIIGGLHGGRQGQPAFGGHVAHGLQGDPVVRLVSQQGGQAGGDAIWRGLSGHHAVGGGGDFICGARNHRPQQGLAGDLSARQQGKGQRDDEQGQKPRPCQPAHQMCRERIMPMIS